MVALVRPSVRWGIVALLTLMLAFIVPTAEAAPIVRCVPGAVQQHDMVGTYASAHHSMTVQVYPCGGIFLQWDNDYGHHYAVYSSVRHLSDGVIATLLPEFPQGLDGQHAIGLKAAEPGYIQIITSVGDDQYHYYRLRKVSNLTD